MMYGQGIEGQALKGTVSVWITNSIISPFVASQARWHPTMALQTGSLDDFDGPIDDKIKIIGLIGPPGAGKGTQCSLLRRDLHFQHLSIGALIREESNRPDNIHAAMIRANQVAGKLNPKELYSITSQKYLCCLSIGYLPLCIRWFGLRSKALPCWLLTSRFPPRSGSKRLFCKFKPLSLVILLECPEQVYIDRLLRRGRFDDNAKSIKGRLNTYHVSTTEVIAAYESSRTLERIKGDVDVSKVQEKLREILLKRGII